MEIHRSYRGDRTLAFVGIGYGLVAFTVGTVLALIDVRSAALSLGIWSPAASSSSSGSTST
ncbi:hypothetical protein ABGB07_10280 [Micromonosporaceae bacterium B7E4]